MHNTCSPARHVPPRIPNRAPTLEPSCPWSEDPEMELGVNGSGETQVAFSQGGSDSEGLPRGGSALHCLRSPGGVYPLTPPNCASSVDPLRAQVEESRPQIVCRTSSK